MVVRTRVVVRAEFCAALRLAHPEMTAEENQAAYGICFSPNGHGHNYLLQVEVEGAIDPRTGLVIDYAILDDLVQEAVITPLDHRNLNQDVPALAGVVPSTEHLARFAWQALSAVLPDGIQLTEIRLQESRDHEIRYFGG